VYVCVRACVRVCVCYKCGGITASFTPLLNNCVFHTYLADSGTDVRRGSFRKLPESLCTTLSPHAKNSLLSSTDKLRTKLIPFLPLPPETYRQSE